MQGRKWNCAFLPASPTRPLVDVRGCRKHLPRRQRDEVGNRPKERSRRRTHDRLLRYRCGRQGRKCKLLSRLSRLARSAFSSGLLPLWRWTHRSSSANTRAPRGGSGTGSPLAIFTRSPRRPTGISGSARNSGWFASMAFAVPLGNHLRVSISLTRTLTPYWSRATVLFGLARLLALQPGGAAS